MITITYAFNGFRDTQRYFLLATASGTGGSRYIFRTKLSKNHASAEISKRSRAMEDERAIKLYQFVQSRVYIVELTL